MNMTKLKQLIFILTPEVMHYNDLAELNGTTTMVYISIIVFALIILVMNCLIVFEYITSADQAASKADVYAEVANRSITFGSAFTVLFILFTGKIPDSFSFFAIVTLFFMLILFVKDKY